MISAEDCCFGGLIWIVWLLFCMFVSCGGLVRLLGWVGFPAGLRCCCLCGFGGLVVVVFD